MISIIIPVYNEEKIIQKTLRALRAELRKPDFEIIVSDAQSSDRTVEHARPYADRVVIEKEPEKRTIARGKNLGAKIAQGDYLVFIDADVIIKKPLFFFKRALSAFTRDPHLVGLTVNLKVFPNEATLADTVIFGLVNLTHRLLNNILHTGSASGEFQMIKKDVFKKLGGYQESLAVAEDNEMFRRLAQAGITRMEKTLTVYHTGRRAHAIGWPRLLFQWFLNALSVSFRKRSAQKEWEAIR